MKQTGNCRKTTKISLCRAAILAQAFLLGLGAMPATADIVHTRGGQQVGVITSGGQGSANVTILTANGEITIPMNRVDRIEKETPGTSYMRLGDAILESGRVPQAMDAYKQGIALEPGNTALAEKLKQAETAMAGQQVAAQQAGEVRVQQAIAEVRDLVAAKRFQEAFDRLRAVEPVNTSSVYAAYQKALADLYYVWGVDRADRQDTPGAIERFRMALKLDPSNEQARLALIRAFENDPTKTQEIADFYSQSTTPADQIKAADAFYRMKEYQKALPIYLKYVGDSSLTNEIMQDRIKIMYNNLHEEAARKGDYETALQLYQDLMQYEPNTDPGIAVRYQYMVRRGQTDMNDPAQRVALAKYAEEQGLYSAAKEEYRNVLQMAPENSEALEGLKRFAAADLQDAVDFYNRGEYLLAQQKSSEFVQNYTRFPDLIEQAQQIYTKAQVEAEKQAKDRQKQAVALALRGDDYYNQGMAYLSNYVSTDVRRNVNVFSSRDEAARFLGQAIYAWQLALSIDPSLGAPTSYNLNWKIADATSKLTRVGNRTPPSLPRRDMDRIQRGQDVTTGAK